MNRWIPVFLCIFLLLPAHAPAQQQSGDLYGTVIDWGDGTSSGVMTITGLPAIQGRKKGSSMATGRRTYEPIVIRKRVDKFSAQLRRAYDTKKRFPRVVMRLRDRQSGRRMQYTMKKVLIKNYSSSAGYETLAINFTKIDYNQTITE